MNSVGKWFKDKQGAGTMRLAYFGFMPNGNEVIGGGEVKTRTVLEALKKTGSFSEIKEIDTSNWKKKIISILLDMIISLVKFDCIIIVASTSSFLRILPLLLFFKNITKCGIHFIPVGNCPSFSFSSNKVRTQIQAVNGIYVQTESIYNRLTECGLQNIYVMHNFKYLNTFFESYEISTPLKFVYFSRVSEVKGIFECIDVFKKLNSTRIQCTLDIYGKIDDGIEDRFRKEVAGLSFVEYKGSVPPDEASAILKDYFMLVFPTKFQGEGFPGVIIDAFAAGVPVLSSRFASFDDLLTDNADCLSFMFENYDEMYAKMVYALNNPERINAMRKRSSENYLKYSPESEISILLRNMQLGGN